MMTKGFWYFSIPTAIKTALLLSPIYLSAAAAIDTLQDV